MTSTRAVRVAAGRALALIALLGLGVVACGSDPEPAGAGAGQGTAPLDTARSAPSAEVPRARPAPDSIRATFSDRCARTARERCENIHHEGCVEALTCHCLEAGGEASGCAEKHTYFWQNWAAERRAAKQP